MTSCRSIPVISRPRYSSSRLLHQADTPTARGQQPTNRRICRASACAVWMRCPARHRHTYCSTMSHNCFVNRHRGNLIDLCLGVPRSTQCMVRRTVCMRYGDLCEIFARLKTTASRTSVGGTQTCSMVAIEVRFAANCTQGNVLRIRRQPGQLEAVLNSTDKLIVLPGEEQTWPP